MSHRPIPPRSGLSRKLAGSAALLISIGIVALVVSRAGVTGCATSAEIAAESPPSASETPTSTAPWADQDDERFMGGAKAPAGNWAFPSKPKPSQTPTSSPQPPSQNPPSPQKPAPQQNPAPQR